MATFTKTHVANRGTATYKSADGLTINVPKSVGVQPETLEIDGLVVPVKESKASAPKLTKEERAAAVVAEKARVAALTLEQRADEMRAKAAAKREKLAKALADADARLNEK